MTAVSGYVFALMLLAATTAVLALLVVRRRRRWLLTSVFVLGTLALLTAGGIYLTTPPQVRSTTQLGRWDRCPYDRIIWSNMPAAVPSAWRPCRSAARVDLTCMLLGAAAATAGVAAGLLRSVPLEVTGHEELQVAREPEDSRSG
jgi:hypothetical protein